MNYKVYLTWEEVDDLVNILKQKVLDELPEIGSVMGIARGGLIPAVMLSHKLGVPYTNLVDPNTLVVDDICDSGVTIKEAPGLYTATLHYKESAIKENYLITAFTGTEAEANTYKMLEGLGETNFKIVSLKQSNILKVV